MRNKMIWIGMSIGLVIGLLLATAGAGLAGVLNPSVGPSGTASQMYTLEQIWQRLSNGAAGTKMTAFSEPLAGPGAGTMHTLDDLMAAAPAVDANGATAADVLSGKTFWGLTGGQWGLKTGAAYPSGVPKTGQTKCYDPSYQSFAEIPCTGTGMDGELQKGVASPNPRFTNNGDGTVTDNLTGLIWLKNANCFGLQDWTTALASANTLNNGECGLSDGSAEGDWRLPNLREMQSLLDYGQQVPPPLPSGHPFTGVQETLYFTSTTYNGQPWYAWNIVLSDGHLETRFKTDPSSYVWPVRGGTP